MKFKSLVILMAVAMVLYAAGNNNEGNNDERSNPRLLNYQGYLTDTLSNPITNPSVPMVFAIFDAVSAGNLKWTEIQGAVGVDKGIFHILLGGVNPIPDSVFKSGADRWLELTIGGQALSPRTRIVSVPYAYSATYSDTALYSINAVPDNDWSFLVSDVADTTLQMGGRWGIARAGNTMYGNADSTHVNLGVGSTTGTNGQNYKYITVGGGWTNSARNLGSTVGGGVGNIASGYIATVGGGSSNEASGTYAAVTGGRYNKARGQYSVVSGGGAPNESDSSSAIGDYSVIGGGLRNRINGAYATIGGGFNNVANGYVGTVAGGSTNAASGYIATVGGGSENIASSFLATVGGGWSNTASDTNAIVSGGYYNYAGGKYSAILGGYADTITATGDYSYLFGINSNLTQDSTFMVDMPHVWFGTEANGYEFPYGRGSNGQVMVTNGSGLLSWGSITYVDSARIAANAYKLQGKDTVDLNNSYVNEGQVNSITNAMIQDAAVTMPKIAQAGATTGQVIKWNGTAWQPAVDSSMDNDWSYRVTDGADTTLQMGGRWGLARAGNTLYGNADSTHVNLGVGSITGTNGQNYKYSTVGGGYGNTASNERAIVGGGYNNTASGYNSTVAGGVLNVASNQYTTIGGGGNNLVSGYAATIGGGDHNRARGQWSVVSGGGSSNDADSNSAIGDYSAIGGGHSNIARGLTSIVGGGYYNITNNEYAAVGGGYHNVVSNNCGSIAGGYDNIVTGWIASVAGGSTNTVSGYIATIGGGSENVASGECATIAGGSLNTASNTNAAVGGGRLNRARGMYSVISGGGGPNDVDSNLALSDYSVIGGGRRNVTRGLSAVIGGGFVNTASNSYATVSGGTLNIASGLEATVGGGAQNTANGNISTIGGGIQNTASNDLGTVSGGGSNTASGNTSTVGGGTLNIASGIQATIGGGGWNTASGNRATVGGGFSNSNAGDWSAILGGWADTITATGSYSYLFGINSNLTQDSTFMIDMPHVWFGTEANGYEFPYGRGTDGQIMKTNGSGILSWGSITYIDSARVAANAHKLQGKDTTDLNNSYVNEGQVNSIANAMIQDAAVTMPKIAQAGATTGQVIKWNGTTWQPGADSSMDNDWSYRVTDGADTTLQMGGRWGIARAGNTLYGNTDSTHVNLGVASTTGANGQNYKYITIGGGYSNTASYNWTTVGGGDRNTAGLSYATVSGGVQNNAGGQCATVSGGSTNVATSECATVAGGNVNTASNYNATVSGGQGNIASGYIATVGGGKVNRARGAYSVVSGGGGGNDADSNSAIGDYSAIGGGYRNIARGFNSAIGGGYYNSTNNEHTAVGGGYHNVVSNGFGSIAGGYNNTVTGWVASVAGGSSNLSSGFISAIGGGSENIASGHCATVSGGSLNIASDSNATVGGGKYNKARGEYSVVSGGGGLNEADSNSAMGDYSSILGGRGNKIAASGDYSYLFGINSNLTQDSTFMVDLPHVWFGTEAAGYEFPYGRGTDGQVIKTNGSGILSWGAIAYVDSARIAANAHKLQGKDTTDLNNSYVNEGQVNSITNIMIQDAAVTMPKIAQAGAVAGQVIKWNGTAWQPGADSSMDNDWNYLVTDGADTTLQMGGRWGIARTGNTLYGTADSTHVNLGIAGTTGANGQNYKYCTVVGGFFNTASNSNATVGGGWNNTASGERATVSGGASNTASNFAAIVSGGHDNTAGGMNSTIAGGAYNIASGVMATVGGGWYNKARGQYSVVSGGGGDTEADSNSAIGIYTAIGGGYRNVASGWGSTIAGGHHNNASGVYTVIGGGETSNAGDYAFVGGGSSHNATGYGSTVGGGVSNTASGYMATIGGGWTNRASGYLAAVNGGQQNTAVDSFSFIGGGYQNRTAGKYSSILVGYADTIFATGDYSYLFGINSNLTQDSTFMVDLPHVWFGTEVNGYEFPYGRGTDGQVMKTNGSGILSWGSITYIDSARVAANAHKLQGKDTVDLDLRWVNEGQVNSVANAMIQDAAVTMPKIAQAGAVVGQVIKWNGAAWQPAADSSLDNDWTYRVTDGADTTLQMGGRWGITRFGNTMYGNVDSTHVNLGLSSVTGRSGEDNRFCTVSGGGYNIANRDRATVSGGWYNTAGNYEATVGGGSNNNAGGNQSTISGGAYNVATDDGGTIGGGYGNTAASGTGFYATVGGGQYNAAGGYMATIGGGENNTASGYMYATVGGGYRNTASGDRATVSGGMENLAAGAYSAILGGYADTIFATGNYSYLFGINSNLTQDSTFMVDLPHVWFGTEAAGYEFPKSRGTNGQALVTNGSGQVSWASTNDNDWVINGSNMYAGVSGNVGIGVTSPTAKLDIAGTVKIADGTQALSRVFTSDASGLGSWQAIPNDNDWTFLVSDGADTTLQIGGQWGLARAGNVLFGNTDSTHVNFGVSCTTGTSGQNNSYCTVSGGARNTATGANATVSGGFSNRATVWGTVVAGGYVNRAAASYASVGGGYNNYASGNNSTVAGGSQNIASGQHGTTGGGCGNTSNGWSAVISGGYYNTVTGWGPAVAGGQYNTINGDNSVIGGGYMNSINSSFSTIPGGYADTIFSGAVYSFLFGINSNLTQDSTFLVDMPHIRFGTEATGYEFPKTDGTNGQALVTNGSGQVSWGTPAALGWTISGNNMYSAVSGNVGIGTSSPAVRLEVRAGTSDTAAIFRGNLVIQSKATGNAVLELGEGLDYAEGFDVTQPDKIKPGTVLVIDPKSPGKLAVSSRAYDTKVAGIVAGGNGLGSGVRLGTGDFDHNVALAGRVYCNVDASTSAVEPGDLLTTASTPGYAMKAQNYDRAKGAVLGKAMERLEKGQKGQILVLVSLQ